MSDRRGPAPGLPTRDERTTVTSADHTPTDAAPSGTRSGPLQSVERSYAKGAERPLGSYGVLLACYSTVVAGLGYTVRRRRRSLPELSAPELALMTVATYRLSRLVAKDSVTAVVRAPFTTFEEASGEGEVNESVTGVGLGHALGELITCPFCLSVWIATVTAFGFVLAPRATRLACSVLAAVTGSDFLQFAYTGVRESQS
jgi:hypothetical protein